MPEKQTQARARRAARQGKAASTQAGEYVREEMEHARTGKHAVKSRRQAIAIGLSKARRSGVKVKPPKRGQASAATRRKATRDLQRGKPGATRARGRSTSRARGSHKRAA